MGKEDDPASFCWGGIFSRGYVKLQVGYVDGMEMYGNKNEDFLWRFSLEEGEYSGLPHGFEGIYHLLTSA